MAKCEQVKKLKLTNKEFLEKLLLVNPDILPLEDYQDSKTKILVQCKKCGFQWNVKPNSLFMNHGCPCCSFSKGEERILKYLEKNKKAYISQKTFDFLYGLKGRKLSYDFYLPEHNLLIEYQGIQHEQPIEYFGGEKQFKVQQEHDKRKKEYAKLHKINLLEIWYYEDINEKLNEYFNKLNKINNLKLESVETVISA